MQLFCVMSSVLCSRSWSSTFLPGAGADIFSLVGAGAGAGAGKKADCSASDIKIKYKFLSSRN